MNEQYRFWLLEEGKSDNTIKRYMTIVHDFQTWYLEHTDESIFDPFHVSALSLQDWKSYLLNEATTKKGNRYAVSTVNNYVKGIKIYFHFLVESDLIQSNPAIKLKPQKVQQETEPQGLSRLEKSRLFIMLPNVKTRMVDF